MKTLDRAIDLLSCFRAHSHLSVEELAEMMGAPRSSVYRFVRVLRKRGFLTLEQKTRKFRVGPALYRLGRTAPPDLGDLAQPVLRWLADETGETSFLSLRTGWQATYTTCAEGRERIRFSTPLGKGVALYAGASAKAILAFLPPEEQKHYLDSVRLERLCTNTIVERKRLERMLLLIRSRGYDFSREEIYRGAWGLAAPVLNGEGMAVGSLAVTGVTFRMPGKRRTEWISLVQQAARGISEQLTRQEAEVV